MGIVLRASHAALGHRGLDLLPARGEGLDGLARDALDLEPPVRVGLPDPASEVAQAPRKLRPVDRADGHLAAEQAVVDHRPPLAVLALHHVGDHGVRMKLRVEVPRRVLPEGRRDHPLAARADHRAGGRVAHPRLDGVRLDPVQRRRHRPVVRLDDAVVAADQRHQRHRLGRAQRHVAAGAVDDVPADLPTPEPTPARNLAFEHRPEALGIDRPGEAQGLRAPARLGAGIEMRGIVLRVVAVPLEAGHALRRRGDLADGRYHRRGAPPVTDPGVSCLCMPKGLAPVPRTARAGQALAQTCPRMSPTVRSGDPASACHPVRFDRRHGRCRDFDPRLIRSGGTSRAGKRAWNHTMHAILL